MLSCCHSPWLGLLHRPCTWGGTGRCVALPSLNFPAEPERLWSPATAATLLLSSRMVTFWDSWDLFVFVGSSGCGFGGTGCTCAVVFLSQLACVVVLTKRLGNTAEGHEVLILEMCP